MEKESIFVLTVQTEENEVCVHLFASFENAVKYVIDRIKEDFINNATCGYVDEDGEIDEEGEKYIAEAKEILEKNSFWSDCDNTVYSIEEKQLED